MDFTTQKIVLGAAGAGEAQSYWWFYSGTNMESFYHDNGLAIDDDNNVYIAYNGKQSAYGGYDNTRFLKLDAEGQLLLKKEYKATSSSTRPDGGISVNSSGNISLGTRAGGAHGVQQINASLAGITGPYTVQTNQYRSMEPRQTLVDSNDNIYVCGRLDYNPYSKGGYIIKLNSSFTIQWSRYIDSSLGYFNYYSITDNDEIIGQQAHGGFSGYRDVIYKLNSSGTLSWSGLIDNIQNNTTAVNATDSSGNVYTIVKQQQTDSNGDYKAMVLKINGSTGALIWMKELKWTNNSFGGTKTYIDVSADGTVHIITPWNLSNGFYYFRISSSGTLTYKAKITTTYSGLSPYSIKAKNKGLYILLGSYYYTGGVLVIKLPDSGAINGSYGAVTIAISYDSITLGNYTPPANNATTYSTSSTSASNYSWAFSLASGAATTLSNFTATSTTYTLPL